MSETYKLFVYGTLKRGFGNNALLSSGKYLNDAVIKGTMYSMGAFPAVSLHGNTDINGEIWEIDEQTLNRCDRLEGHPDWYLRQKINTSEGPAWVYTQDADMQLSNRPVVKSGVWERKRYEVA